MDFLHVAQCVWKASLALFHDNQAAQDRWVRAHLVEILRGKAGIRRSAALRAKAAAERQAG